MSFLKAEWRKLILANYEIDPKSLNKYLPYKTELDNWNDKTYVSLVGFMFRDTKLLGIKIPFHVNFEEVNLRFYVKYKDKNEWKRGVVFIKELVPKSALTLVANIIYKEHYGTVPMNHKWDFIDSSQYIEYSWTKNDRKNILAVKAQKEPRPILPNSEEEFTTEHYWGYTRVHSKKTFEYEVKHPSWDSYKIEHSNIEVDFGAVYGSAFKVLSQIKPNSIMLMEGSEISVENKRVLT